MASVKLKFNTKKTLSDGTHPIIIQVLHNRRKKEFYLGRSATIEQWNIDKECTNKKHPYQAEVNSRIKNGLLTMNKIITDFENKHQHFTIDDIENKFKLKSSGETLNDYVDLLLERFEKEGKTGNSRVYKYMKNSFNRFAEGKSVKLADIDAKKIKDYESHMKIIGNSVNTISVHLRTLRAVINKAIKEGILENERYPFKNISIKHQKTRKRAVNKDIIKLVEELDVSKEDNLQLWKDLFMFSFYNRGMNVVDMAFLKVKNIEAGRLNYTRRKTGQHFSIKLTDKSKEILSRYNDLNEKDSYIFPIIYRKGYEYKDYRNAMRLMNKKLKKISELLNLDIPLTTYVSRHSWATIAKKSGIPTSIISEGLGHESEETTQVYLDSFENDVLDDANDLIIG
ncbi:phage integrase SAM-like domain-containing protein [Sunxiuqinia sp. A32]|uniref:phage integrase SAM-like domain-containing protein n=1 Tax=Sunxiuqinia sp. A32 TaxID=3461496 RepID=UPI004045C3EA